VRGFLKFVLAPLVASAYLAHNCHRPEGDSTCLVISETLRVWSHGASTTSRMGDAVHLFPVVTLLQINNQRNV